MLKVLISRGILFEDTGVFLRWGSEIIDLAKIMVINERRFADRLVYNRGEHNILKGLNHKEISETETVMEWIINEVRLYLRHYKQYNTDKVQFEIGIK
jgi:hypothetical protein